MYRSSSKNKKKSSGIDGVTIGAFNKSAGVLIPKISRTISTRSYEPRSLKPVFLPRPNKKDRVICIPTVEDRLVQRSLVGFLTENGYNLNNSISYGFIKNKSAKDAARQACELRKSYPWAYKADISSFFDSIARDVMKEKVKSFVRLRSLHQLIFDFIDTEIYAPDRSAHKKLKKLGIEPGKGLRQGMPISPYLANLLLRNFDREIEKQNIPMVRYADDLIAFSNSEEGCMEIDRICRDLLTKEKLSIYPLGDDSKTTIASPQKSIEFLGLGLESTGHGYSIVVTKSQRDTIKQRVLEDYSFEASLRKGLTLASFSNSLESKIQGYRSAYDNCANKSELEDILASTKERCIKAIVHDVFGVDYSELTRRKRKFIGLKE